MENLRKITSQKMNEIGLTDLIRLPLLEENLDIRSKTDLISRINILHIFYAIYLRGKESYSFFGNAIQELNIVNHLTNKEKIFLDTGEITSQDIINFSWNKESIKMLLWIGSLINEDFRKTFSECDFSNYYKFIPPEKTNSLFEDNVILREKKQIFEYLDFYYCLHWYCKHFSKHNKFDKLNFSVVLERRKALEWVTHPNFDWDNIPLDT